MGGRANAAIEEQSTRDQRQKAKEAYDTAKEELDAIKAARPVEELEALVANARPVCRVHVSRGSRRTVCTKPPALVAELGRAKSRQQLKADMDKATERLSVMHTPKIANSDALALQGYLQGLGFDITADRLNKLLVLLAVLVIECGGGMALAVGMSLSDKGAGAQSVQTETTHSTMQPAAETPVNGAQIDLVRTVHSPAQSSRDRLLDMVRNANGALRTGHRGLGEALGVSATRAGQLLRDLAAEGLIRVRSSKTGSVITLTPRVVEAS
jgi:hypothetical protein